MTIAELEIGKRDYLTVICDEMNFIDLSHLKISHLKEDELVDHLATEFKNKLSDIKTTFVFNEDNEIFIPLRPYFATALRYVIENTDPNDYPKYIKLRDDIGYGLEIVYFNEIVLPEIADQVYDNFFIDPSHPLLYNSKDGRDNYSFTRMHGKYGFIHYGAMIDKLAGIKPFYSEDDFKALSEDAKAVFEKKWTDDYLKKIPLIFSKITTEQCKPMSISFND